MHQSLWLNCTIWCWLLRWFEPLKFQLDLTPASGPRPCVCRCMSPADWEMFPMCTVPGVWSGWDPTVHYCARVSLGVGARHNCSHCISAALCVIINCPHNNWRFVILARISHSSSPVVRLWRQSCDAIIRVSFRMDERKNEHFFNSFTRLSGWHEASLWADNKRAKQESWACVLWALLSETSSQDLGRICSPSQISSGIVSINHNSQQISGGHSLSPLTMNEAWV